MKFASPFLTLSLMVLLHLAASEDFTGPITIQCDMYVDCNAVSGCGATDGISFGQYETFTDGTYTIASGCTMSCTCATTTCDYICNPSSATPGENISSNQASPAPSPTSGAGGAGGAGAPGNSPGITNDPNGPGAQAPEVQGTESSGPITSTFGSLVGLALSVPFLMI